MVIILFAIGGIGVWSILSDLYSNRDQFGQTRQMKIKQIIQSALLAIFVFIFCVSRGAETASQKTESENLEQQTNQNVLLQVEIKNLQQQVINLQTNKSEQEKIIRNLCLKNIALLMNVSLNEVSKAGPKLASPSEDTRQAEKEELKQALDKDKLKIDEDIARFRKSNGSDADVQVLEASTKEFYSRLGSANDCFSTAVENAIGGNADTSHEYFDKFSKLLQATGDDMLSVLSLEQNNQ
jgi:hypothetical protein